MSLQPFGCDGCAELIPPHKARLHCDDCVGNHNICANCYVVGNYTQLHAEGHECSLIEKSGYMPKPPPMPLRPKSQIISQPVASPQQQYAAAVSHQQLAPASASTATPQFAPPPAQQQVRASPAPAQVPYFPPPPLAPLPATKQTRASPSPSPRPGAAVQAVAQPKVQAQAQPRVQAQAQAHAQPKTQARGGWQPLFQGSSATPIFVAFLEAIFAKIDTDKDGLLTPEQYSSFLDAQGYALEEDVWKKFHKPIPGFSADDIADYECTTSYENWSIEHRMAPRPNAQPNTYVSDMISTMPFDASFAKLMNSTIATKSFSYGMMPMLTLRGLIDITVVETLCEPAPGWKRVNMLARHYNIWREWGDAPRSVMPDACPRDLTERIKRVTQASAARNSSRINANAARLRMELDGQDAALRLLDPPGTRYYTSYR